jgi:ATP-dependent Clp protease ATP-binding subunit ClpA
VFERFTPETRAVIVQAQDAARALRHPSLGTEHLLLGLLRGDDNGAAEVLGQRGVHYEEALVRVLAMVAEGDTPLGVQVSFTPQSKTVLEHSMRLALATGSERVEPEHLLLGLLREDETVAARALLQMGVELRGLRDQILERMQPPAPGRVAPTHRTAWNPHASIEVGIGLTYSQPLRQLLMAAGARALEDGRTEIGIDDVFNAHWAAPHPPDAPAAG